MLKMKDVKNGGEGKFVVNGNITVFDIEPTDTGLVYSVDWDDETSNENDAIAIAEDFIRKTLAGILNNKDEESNEDVYTPN